MSALSLLIGVLVIALFALLVRERRHAISRHWMLYLREALPEGMDVHSRGPARPASAHPEAPAPVQAEGSSPSRAEANEEVGSEVDLLHPDQKPLDGSPRVASWELDIGTQRLRLSREAYSLFGFGPDERPTPEELTDRTHPDDRVPHLRAVRATMRDYGPFEIEHRLQLPDQVVRWVQARGRVELDAAGRPARVLCTAKEITDRKRTEEALVQRTLHDPLTGLANRALLVDRLGQALNRQVRRRSTVGVISLDIDRFSVINDSLGHTVGDQVLLALAARITGLLPVGDTLARVEGDEFLVICEGGPGELGALLERLRSAMTDPLVWEGGQLAVSVSVGLAFTTGTSDGPESLLAEARTARYRAKDEASVGPPPAKPMASQPEHLAVDEAVISGRQPVEPHDHSVHFYGHDDDLVADLTPFLATGLRAGEAVLVVATQAHRRALDAALDAALGVDLGRARRAGRYQAFDAAEVLAAFMVDGKPDRQRFRSFVGGLLTRMGQGRPIRAFGEMVALLWDASNVSAAIELESLWNELICEHELSLYCAYSMSSLATHGDLAAAGEICAHHSTFVPPLGCTPTGAPLDEQAVDSFQQSFARLLDGLDTPPAIAAVV